MEIKIKENIIKIKLNKKINELENKNIIEVFCLISAFKTLEKKQGNEYEKAWIKIKYIKNMMITEYINIFKIIRIPSLYDFVKYFKTINEGFEQQGIDTNINLDDYIEQSENISQEIIIIMVFKIKTSIKELENKQKILINLLKINNTDKEVFEIIKNEK